MFLGQKKKNRAGEAAVNPFAGVQGASVAMRTGGTMQGRGYGTVARGSAPKFVYQVTARAERPEKKTVDIALSNLRYSSDAAVANCLQHISLIPQGNTSITRVGKSCILKALAMRGRISAGTASVYEKCASMLIWVRSPNLAATLPAIAEILATQSPDSLTNRDNANKFKILRRWDHIVTGNLTAPATGNEFHNFEEYIPLKNLECQWKKDDTTGVIASCTKGALLFFTVGLNVYGATTTPLFNGNFRLYFEDP